MVKVALIASLLAGSFVTAAAEFKVISPGGSDLWWVAKSQNVIAWACNDSPPATQYTVSISNKDLNILSGPKDLIATVDNTICSLLVTPDQSDITPATGYTVALADILNRTHVYAASEEFEVKAAGSSYPTTTPPIAEPTTATGGSNSATNSASGSDSKPSDGAAAGMKGGLFQGGVFAAVAAALGLVAAL
jgi:hypothetical protein